MALTYTEAQIQALLDTINSGTGAGSATALNVAEWAQGSKMFANCTTLGDVLTKADNYFYSLDQAYPFT